MKEVFEFRQFLKNNVYDKDHFNLREMFKIYSSLSIFSIKDLKGSPYNFLDTLLSSFDCIKFKSAEDLACFNFDLDDFVYSLQTQLEDSDNFNPNYFTKIVTELAPSKDSTRLLEVGAGEIPFSSIVLARDFQDVTTMDKLLLSSKCLKNFNLKGKDKFFDDNTSVEEYDFVVGQRPCSAIESIVKNASASNKPYFLELCGCELEKIAQRTGEYKDWDEILPEYDSKIQFYQHFAFNIDASPSQVGKLIEASPAEAIIDKHKMEAIANDFFELGYLLMQASDDDIEGLLGQLTDLN